jgi:hypothetical protein
MSSSQVENDPAAQSLRQLPSHFAMALSSLGKESAFGNLGLALASEAWTQVQDIVTFDRYGKIEPSYNAQVYSLLESSGRRTTLFLDSSLRRLVAPLMYKVGYALCRVRGIYAATRDAQGFATVTEIIIRPFTPGLPYNLEETIASVARQLGSLIPDDQLPSQG